MTNPEERKIDAAERAADAAEKSASFADKSADAASRQAKAAEDASEYVRQTAVYTRQSARWLKWSVVALLLGVILASIFSYFTWDREKKLSYANKRSQIQAIVSDVAYDPAPKDDSDRPDRRNRKSSYTSVKFDLVNYSGFDAQNIYINLKFSDMAWIFDWARANAKEGEEKTVIDAQRISVIPLLEAKKSLSLPPITGEYSLEEACEKRIDVPVFVRLIRQSKNGYIANREQEFKIICTTVDGKKVFSMHPVKIISRED